MKRFLSILFFCLIAFSGFSEEYEDYKITSDKYNLLVRYNVLPEFELITIEMGRDIISLSVDNLEIFRNALKKAIEWSEIAKEKNIDEFHKGMENYIFEDMINQKYIGSFFVIHYSSYLVFFTSDEPIEIPYTYFDELDKYTDINYLRNYAEEKRKEKAEKKAKNDYYDTFFN